MVEVTSHILPSTDKLVETRREERKREMSVGEVL